MERIDNRKAKELRKVEIINQFIALVDVMHLEKSEDKKNMSAPSPSRGD